MKIIAMLFVVLFCTMACNHNKSTPSKLQGRITNVKKEANHDISNCFYLSDTILNIDNWVKYIKIGERYFVEVKVNKVLDTIDFSFDCNTPQVLVPNFLWKKHNSIFLTRGSGFNFRELFLCTQIGDSIALQRFESERGDDAHFDFGYKFENDSHVHLYDNLNKHKRKLLLPLLYKNKRPILYRIFKKRLELKFADSVLNTSVRLTR